MDKKIVVPLVVASVVTHPKAENVAMGIAGVQIGYQPLADIFNSIVNKCSGVGTDECFQCNATGNQCFLTTQTGQILVSTFGEKAVNGFLFA